MINYQRDLGIKWEDIIEQGRTRITAGVNLRQVCFVTAQTQTLAALPSVKRDCIDDMVMQMHRSIYGDLADDARGLCAALEEHGSRFISRELAHRLMERLAVPKFDAKEFINERRL